MISALLLLGLAATPDPCAVRPAILEVRAADDARRRELLTAWASRAHAITGRARGCAAAVAAEAARALGEQQHAAAWLGEVSADLPELADTLGGHRALLLAGVGRHEEARAILLGPQVSEQQRARIALAIAQAARDQAAIDVALAPLDDAPALALACQRGRRAACQRLLLDHPRATEARALEDAWLSRWSTRGLAERGRALIRAARPSRAALELERHQPPADAPAADRDELSVQLVTALVRADRLEDALARSAALVTTSPTSDALLKVRAWALSKAGRFGESQEVWQALARNSADPALQAEAIFYAGFARYEGADLEGAQAFFTTTALAEGSAVVGSAYEAAARWYVALLALLRDRPAEARVALEELVARFPGDRELLKHRYWLARARIASGDAARGQSELEQLAQQEPIDFYGLLARRRLGQAPIKGARLGGDAVIKLASRTDDAKRARLLYALGFDEEAHAAARATGADLAAIGLCQSLDDAHWGWKRGALFLPLPRVQRGALRRSAGWRVSFATPWSVAVDDAAKRAGIPSSFVYAIMRTESGFDAGAVSVAGARGVIQLMPSAARGAARLAGRAESDAERIFEPEVAIDLGAALLGTERRELGSLLLTAAAYNGGAHNVSAWLTQFRALELELFIERIPFKETRNYVKQVLAAEASYRALAGGALSLELPDVLPAPPAQVTHFNIDE